MSINVIFSQRLCLAFKWLQDEESKLVVFLKGFFWGKHTFLDHVRNVTGLVSHRPCVNTPLWCSWCVAFISTKMHFFSAVKSTPYTKSRNISRISFLVPLSSWHHSGQVWCHANGSKQCRQTHFLHRFSALRFSGMSATASMRSHSENFKEDTFQTNPVYF